MDLIDISAAINLPQQHTDLSDAADISPSYLLTAARICDEVSGGKASEVVARKLNSSSTISTASLTASSAVAYSPVLHLLAESSVISCVVQEFSNGSKRNTDGEPWVCGVFSGKKSGGDTSELAICDMWYQAAT
jgi:hypothetical protein